jgi:hypothetical protein
MGPVSILSKKRRSTFCVCYVQPPHYLTQQGEGEGEGTLVAAGIGQAGAGRSGVCRAQSSYEQEPRPQPYCANSQFGLVFQIRALSKRDRKEDGDEDDTNGR